MTSFRRALGWTLRIAGLALLAALGTGALLGYRAYRAFASDLPPRLDVVTDYRPLRASQVLSADGELIGQFYIEKRVLLPVDQIPKRVKDAFVAAEDARFYSHGGVDWLGVARAAWANFRAGHVVQGGSTITQQVAKLLLVGKERSLARKIREAMLAHRIEQRLTKEQILGIYVNHVYLGHGAYGVAAAAAAYFGKEVKDLSVAEAAMLAGLPKAPGRATPFHDFARAEARQRYVLAQMQELGFLTPAEAAAARQEALVLVSRQRNLKNVAAPYFVETIRRYVADNYGDEELLERGLRITTTLDMRKQRAAEVALREGLDSLRRRIGDGHEAHDDGQADGQPVQGALIALDPSNGHLVSMVGGYDYDESQFNRAVQAHRQIGSALKPFIYTAAVERGMNELTIRYDRPVKFTTASGSWAPHNYKRDYLGPLTLRTAIAKSVNTVSAQLVSEMGVDAVIDTMRRLGIRSPLPHALPLALGAADLTLEEVAYAIATFPAGGEKVTPVFITRLTDADGRVLEDHTADAPRARRVSAETAYVVTDLMKGVVEIGTGKKARELGRPAAGKTGTSTGYRDAWFFGFTPDLVCGVWIGRDDFKPIAHDATGGQTALPIWLAYMREAEEGRPVRDFVPPPGIVFARADPDKGLPAPPGKAGSRLTPFSRGTLPPAFKTAAYAARFSDERF
jgi:penicillin-binding protein 1A